jgi:hypothetical protein
MKDKTNIDEILIENEKSYQRKKIINYGLIIILILLLIRCSPLGDGLSSELPKIKEEKKELIIVPKIIKNKDILLDPIIKVIEDTEIVVKNITIPTIITPTIPTIITPIIPSAIIPLPIPDSITKIYSDIPAGFDDIEDTDIITLFVDVVVNNVNKGILQVDVDKEFIYIKNIELFKGFLNEFKFKNQILNEITESKMVHKINKKLYTSFLNEINETLYINNYENSTKLKETSKYIAQSDSDFSILQNLNVSYFNDYDNNFNIGGSLYLTKGENKIITNWNKDKEKLNVNHLYYNWENERHNVSLGYMNYNSATNALITTNDFLGIQYKQNKNKIKSNINDFIIINISHDSLIKFFKDDKLILTKRYSFGTHKIPTNLFPEGNYFIDIEINNGNSIVKQQEYIKNTKQSAGLVIDFGVLKKDSKDILFTTQEELFAKSSYQFKFDDNINFTPEVLYSDSNALFNSNIHWTKNSEFFNGRYFIDGNFLIGNKGAEGQQINFGVNNEKHNLSYTYFNVKNESNIFINQPNKNHRFNYNYYDKGIGSINVFYNKNDYLTNNNELYGIKYRNRYNISLKNDIDYDISFNRSNNENFFGLQFTYRFNQDDLNFSSTLKNNNGEYSNKNNFHKNREFNNYRENISASATFNENNDNVYQIGYKIQNENYGYFEHDFYYKEQLNYYGNASTNIGYNNEKIGYGGSNNKQSGVIVNIKSKEDTYFYVIINNRKKEILSNQNIFIPLSPYQEFELFVEPIEKNISQKIDKPTREFTLSKGNIKTFTWEVKTSKVLIGNLYNDNGVLLKNKVFSYENNMYSSDNKGLINLSINEGDNIFVFKEFSCNISINSKENFIFEKEIICKEEEK